MVVTFVGDQEQIQGYAFLAYHFEMALQGTIYSNITSHCLGKIT